MLAGFGTCECNMDLAEEDFGDKLDALPAKNPFIRGSDPRVATCRGRLQTRRCQLNQEINKELRLRAGAENLFKATTNRKLRETVALELSFVNSNLQLLKEQLAELNSSVELYQNDSKECVMPMIPLGLKETKEVDFREPFKDFILEHYSEDAAAYEEAISDFMDMRQAMRTPVRATNGVALLFRYYNQLYFIERRFFPPDRSLGIYFEWFDSLTGVPSCQRTVAFEKACVLFNMSAIYTQIGAKQERRSPSGLDGAVDALLRAAGTLRYIHENFTNAPSVDLSADTLDVLVSMMMAQARECLFDKLQLQAREQCSTRDLELCDDLDLCLDLCQESAQVSQCYTTLYQKMQSESVFHYVPYTWVSLVHVKTEFYKGLAHHHCATGLLNIIDNAPLSAKAKERLSTLYSRERTASTDRTTDNQDSKEEVVYKPEDRLALGKAHLREAISFYEEAMRLQRMCRELRSKDALTRVLREHRERATRESAMLEEGPDFSEILDAPHIQPSTKFQLSLTSPDFAQHRVEDLFKPLGPVAIFSAKRHWSAPRLVQLQKYPTGGRHLHHHQRSTRKTADGEILRNGMKALRSDKRDHSEDNTTYYNQKDIIRSDEKYSSDKPDLYNNNNNDIKKRLHRISVTKQNGVYINGYNSSNNYESNYQKDNKNYDSDYSNNKLRYLNGSESRNGRNDYNRLSKSKENGAVYPVSVGRQQFGGRNGVKNGEALRRVSSDYNISCTVSRVEGDDGFGFSVRGDAPVIVASVEPNSLADLGGMREGDFIVGIGERDVKWSSHDEVVRLIKAAGDTLPMKLVTPMDRNYLKGLPDNNTESKHPSPTNSKETSSSGQGSVSAASTASSGSGQRGSRGPNTWNPFRRHAASRDSSSQRGSHANVIFR